MITDLKINAERKQFYYEKGYWTEKTLGDRYTHKYRSSTIIFGFTINGTNHDVRA